MKYEDFEKFIKEKCMYETIYDDSNGRQVLIIQMLDAYGMVNKAITALRLAIDVQNMASESTYKAALAQPAQQEQNNTYVYASNLAKTIWQKHYMKESPKFALLDTTEGVLTQIDNMTCGLVREKPAQQEPVAWSSYEYDGIHHKPVAWMDSDGNVSDNNDHKCFPIPLYTITHPTPTQRTWVGLDEKDFSAINQSCLTKLQAATSAESVLKEKNNGLL